MSTIVKPFTFSAGATIVASEHNSNFDTLYSDYNGNITNVNISASAAIAASKLNLATIAQNMAMSSAILKTAKGADVASVAGTMTLGDDGNFFDITGTNAITSITAKTAGTIVTLQFDSTATLTDGSNLKLNGNFTGAADATITLVSDGTNWYEVARSTGGAAAATQAEMETATSTTTYVSPGRLQYHPASPKAWVLFDGTASNPITPAASYGISGNVAKSGTGLYSVTFSTAFASATTYGLVGSPQYDAASNCINVCLQKESTTPRTTTVCKFATVAQTGSPIDSGHVFVAFYGDQ